MWVDGAILYDAIRCSVGKDYSCYHVADFITRMLNALGKDYSFYYVADFVTRKLNTLSWFFSFGINQIDVRQ